jgi:hypothetical protein
VQIVVFAAQFSLNFSSSFKLEKLYNLVIESDNRTWTGLDIAASRRCLFYGFWRELWSYNLIVESDNLIWTGSDIAASGRQTSIGLICGFWREIHGVFV